MNEKLKYLLEEIKDTTLDYIGTNGCKYQDLSRWVKTLFNLFAL